MQQREVAYGLLEDSVEEYASLSFGGPSPPPSWQEGRLGHRFQTFAKVIS